MNIKDDFVVIEAYLEMATEKVDRQDYASAIDSLCKANSHISELLLQVGKLVASKDNVELSDKGS